MVLCGVGRELGLSEHPGLNQSVPERAIMAKRDGMGASLLEARKEAASGEQYQGKGIEAVQKTGSACYAVGKGGVCRKQIDMEAT